MIILSAALDLVGPSVPKGVVLLCDVIPSFLIKLLAPYLIQNVSYSIRIVVFSAISAGGMLLVALPPPDTDSGTISIKMVGVVLASLSSGGGEQCLLGMTHFYGPFSLAAWGCGTGAAGLIGAGAYALATTSLGLTSQTTLLASAFLPVIMLISFYAILPRGPLARDGTTKPISESRYESVAGQEDDQHHDQEREGLLANARDGSSISGSFTKASRSQVETFKPKFHRSRSLFFP